MDVILSRARGDVEEFHRVSRFVGKYMNAETHMYSGQQSARELLDSYSVGACVSELPWKDANTKKKRRNSSTRAAATTRTKRPSVTIPVPSNTSSLCTKTNSGTSTTRQPESSRNTFAGSSPETSAAFTTLTATSVGCSSTHNSNN